MTSRSLPARPPGRDPQTYLYIAAKPTGGRSVGLVAADHETALARGLSKRKLILLRAYRVPDWLIRSRRELSLKDQAQMNEQLGRLLERGVPLVEALEVTADTVSARARPAVQTLRELVSQGRSFARASVEAGAVDTVTAAVYEAAERTGDLAGACAQLSRSAARRLKIAETARTLLFYPLIVLTISIMVGLFMLAVVVPMVADAMEGILPEGQSLPAVTRSMATAGRVLRGYPLAAAGVGAGLLAAAVLLRAPLAAALAQVLRRLPVAKELLLAQESARFFSVMAAMASGGVPLAEALGVANQTIHLPKLRTQLDALRTGLIDGGLLRVLIERVQALPIATRRLLIAADRAGDLDSAFASLADDHAQYVDQRSARLLAVLEPLLIVLIFLVIGSMIVALMAPMLSLSQSAFAAS
jgi:type II secretory pathway component PulF